MKRFFILAMIALCFGVRYAWYEQTHRSQIPESWFDSRQTVQGIIVRDPDRGIHRTRIVLLHEDYGKILVTLPTGSDVWYGDRVTVSGVIKKPDSFETDTGRIFNYPKYLAVQNIFALMRADIFSVESSGNGNTIATVLYDIKYFLVTTMRQLFDPAQAALLAGIVVGEQSLFPRQTLDDFQLAGLTHIIVLSGYNITIVMTFFVTLFAYIGFGYYGRRIGGILAIPFFILMTGMGTSLVRAGIMAIVGTLLDMTFRPQYSFKILIITAGVMIFHNPRILLHSPSFHLSFLAFVGLVYVVPLAKQFVDRFLKESSMRDIVIETLAIQMFVIPYIIWMNGRISLLSILANTITLPIIPVLMFTGFFITLASAIVPLLGGWITMPISWGLLYILWVAQKTASFTGFSTVVKPFSVWWMILVYGILVVIISCYHQKNHV